MTPRPTADQLETAIANALAAGDTQAVVDILEVLAMIDPRHAETVLHTIQTGLAIAERRASPNNTHADGTINP